MQYDQGIEDAPQNGSRILFSVVATFFDLVKQLFAIEMFQNQMNIVVRFEDFVELEDVWVPNLPQQANLIMQAKDGFDVVLEHRLIYGLQSKLSLFDRIMYLVNLCKIALANDVTYLILASKILESSKILEKLKPFTDQVALLVVDIFASQALIWTGEHNDFVDEPNQDGLLQIGGASITEFAFNYNCLIRLL